MNSKRNRLISTHFPSFWQCFSKESIGALKYMKIDEKLFEFLLELEFSSIYLIKFTNFIQIESNKSHLLEINQKYCWVA